MRLWKLPVAVFLSVAVGILFVVLPCLFASLLGTQQTVWCGYKAEPKYTFELFGSGFVVALMSFKFFFFRRNIVSPRPPRE